MTTEMKNLTSVAAILAVLMAAPAMLQAAGTGTGSAWDSDGDGQMNKSEFSDGFSERGVFDKWDQDSDGMLSDREFNKGVYDAHDMDRSGDLSDTEYGMAKDGYGGAGFWRTEDAGYDYQEWDSDGDMTLSDDEFSEGWGKSGMFDDWDSDGDKALSQEEFSAGVYDKYDKDRDGTLNESESAAFSEDNGSDGFWDS